MFVTSECLLVAAVYNLSVHTTAVVIQKADCTLNLYYSYTVDVERFAGLNLRGFDPIEFFMEKDAFVVLLKTVKI